MSAVTSIWDIAERYCAFSMETERERERRSEGERERELLLWRNYMRFWKYRENQDSELIVIFL